MKKNVFFLVLAIAFSSCYDKPAKPALAEGGQTENLTMNTLAEDTTKTLTLSMPIIVDSARRIVAYEIILADAEGAKKEENSSKMRGEYYNGAYIVNLVFEEPKTGDMLLLTDKQIFINAYEIYADNFFIYNIVDRDSNGDGILNLQDVRSLYVSNIDGTSFKKITKDKESVVRTEWVAFLNRYYFVTVEDTNNDGSFDRKDKMHYYYVEFKDQDYKVKEYFTLDILKK